GELGLPMAVTPYRRGENWIKRIEKLIYQPLTVIEKNVPKVEVITQMASPWKSFFLEGETGIYYGSLRITTAKINNLIKKEDSDAPTVSEKRVSKLISSYNIAPYKREIINARAEPVTVYPFEEVYNAYLLDKSKRVELIEDENDSNYGLVEFEGKLVGSKTTIAERLKKNGVKTDSTIGTIVTAVNKYIETNGIKAVTQGYAFGLPTSLFEYNQIFEGM